MIWMTHFGGTYECRHHPVTGEYGLLIWDIPLFNFTYPKDFIFRPYRPGVVTPGGGAIQETLPIPVVRAEYVWLPAWERPWEYMYYNPRRDGYIQNPPTGDQRPGSRRGNHFQMDERFEFIRRAGFPSMLNSEQPHSSLPPRPCDRTPDSGGRIHVLTDRNIGGASARRLTRRRATHRQGQYLTLNQLNPIKPLLNMKVFIWRKLWVESLFKLWMPI